jgi:hypothetical protein
MAVRDVVLLIGTLVGVTVLAHFVTIWLTLFPCAVYLVWIRFQRPKIRRLMDVLRSE